MIQLAPPQLRLDLATECIHCGAKATARISCGEYAAAVCTRDMPSPRQLEELSALDGVEVRVEEIA